VGVFVCVRLCQIQSSSSKLPPKILPPTLKLPPTFSHRWATPQPLGMPPYHLNISHSYTKKGFYYLNWVRKEELERWV